MSDLIDRRQAIDVINKEQKEIDVSDVSAMYAYSKCKTIIKELPSAQPEPIKINIEDFNKEDWERLKKEWRNTPITVLSAQPKRGKWIKYEQEFMLEGSLGTVQKTVRECSVCTAKIAGMVGIMNFCPNCGEDMRGEQDE